MQKPGKILVVSQLTRRSFAIVEKGRRAAAAATKYSPDIALARYRDVIRQALSGNLRS